MTFKSDVASAFLNLPAYPLSIIIFLLFAVSSLEMIGFQVDINRGAISLTP